MTDILTRTHGIAVWPEYLAGGHLEQVDGQPWTDVVGLTRGWGKTFRGGTTENWFHIPIPTVAYLNILYLDQFFVFFTATLNSSNYCGVDQVDVYDGNARIWSQSLPEVMAGDWSNPRTNPPDRFGISISNTWMPRQGTQRFLINTGLSISLHVSFIRGGDITFHSAGANWTDIP